MRTDENCTFAYAIVCAVAAVVNVVIAAVTVPALAHAAPGPSAYSSPVPSPSGSTVKWLCHPGITGDPCDLPNDRTDLGTGKRYPATRVPETAQKVDCFYVYPTITDNLGFQAPAEMTPPVRDVTRMQASPFQNQCRIYAPLYRELTTFGLAPAALTALAGNRAMMQTAYNDVKHAWKEFQRTRGSGRGFMLIGHSQGTMMLRKLIREEIDPNPAVRAEMVGALLMGGNVLTRPGSTTGGDFQHIPLCTRSAQTGCVVAYSTELTALPSLFGNSTLDALSLIMGLPFGPQYQVACTDPRRLSGIYNPVGITLVSAPYSPGVIRALLTIMTLPALEFPTSSSTWTTGPGRYTVSCVDPGTFHRLRATPINDRQQLGEVPLFNTHLGDMNLGVEYLTTIVHDQVAAYHG